MSHLNLAHPKAQRLLGVLLLSVVISLAAASLLFTPIQAAPPERPLRATYTIGCSVHELTTTIHTANANPGPDTLNLAAGCVYTLTQVDNTLGGANGLPAITDSLTISGNGATIVRDSAAPNFRVILITGTVPVTLENLRVTQGDVISTGVGCPAEGCGGGIYAFDDLTLMGVTVFSNTAFDDGGGVFVEGDATVIAGRFERNFSQDDYGAMDVGGNLVMSGTTVISNVAVENGGGGNIDGNATIENSRFEANTALTDQYGGLDVDGDLAVTNTTFTNNTAGFAVGGLEVDGNLTMTGTNIVSNTAFFDIGGVYVYGLATIANSRVERNAALLGDIGGLAVGDLVMTDTVVVSNTAEGYLGGAYVDGLATIANSHFEGNIARFGDIGGLYVGFDLLMTGTTIISNTAGEFFGGAAVDGDAAIFNSRFERNTAQVFDIGGLGVGGNLFMTNTSVISNTAGETVGGVYVEFEAVVVNSTFEHNTALFDYTGALDVGSLVMTNTTFANNAAGSFDGAVYVYSDAVIVDSRFERNSAGLDEGALGVFGNLNMTNTDFISNTAGDYDGAAYVDGNAVINGGQFAANTADFDHSALHIFGAMQITGTSFIANQTPGPGGALVQGGFRASADGRIVNALFGRNRTGSDGGAAILLDTTGTVDLIHTTIASPTLANSAALVISGTTVNITNTIIASHTIGISNTTGMVTEDYNLFYGNTNNTAGSVTSGGKRVSGNPAFVDQATNDYRLSPRSTAINSGVNAGVGQDFFGDPRPGGSGYDIGYDETNYDLDLVISKVVEPAKAVPGEAITYTLTFTAGGTGGVARNVVITDRVPVSLTRNSLNVNSNLLITPTGSISYVWQLPDLAFGDRGQITITGVLTDPLPTAIITNTADITTTSVDTDTTNNTTRVGLSVSAETNLTIDKSDHPDPVVAGQQLTYLITVTNQGPANARDVVVTDTLSSEVTIDTVTGCNNVDPTGERCELGKIEANTAVTYTLVVTANANTTGTITNIAQVTSSSPLSVTGDDRVIQTTSVNTEADLTIAKGDSPDPVTAGNQLTYIITVTNNGPSHAQGVVVTDTLPSGVTLVSTSGCAEDPNGVPNCSLGPVNAGSSANYTILVTVDAGTAGTLTNNADVGASTPLINPGDDTISETTTVDAEADLAISKHSVRTNSSLPDNTVITYTVTVDNNGPTATAGAVIDDPIPSSVSGFAWSCVSSGGVICPNVSGAGSLNESTGFFPAGAQLIYTIQATVVSSDTVVTNTATVTTLTGLGDPDGSNNSATDVSESVRPIYFPIILKNYAPPPPDLVIDNLLASTNAITIVIRNAGMQSVEDAFWVDAYLNLGRDPALHEQGPLYWGLSVPNGGVPLGVGAVVTLTVGSPYFAGGNPSIIVPGTEIRAQVDSIGPNAYGAVLEFDEGNNVAGPRITITGADISALDVSLDRPFNAASLPPRIE